MDNRIVARELRKLEDKHGRVTPDILIKAARNPKNPLHGMFEWDTERGFRLYLVQRARQIISSVKLKVELNEKTVRAVAYVRDPDKDAHSQGYRSVRALSRDGDAAREAIVQEFARAAAHLRRARDLAAALGKAGEVDDLVQRVVRVSDAVQEVVN